MMKYKSIKGMNDILPDDAGLWHFVEQTAREHFALYGYMELRTPVLEETSLFQRSVGELSDIVKKEMYTFEDKGGDSLTLRPEGTASIVRSAIEHNLINPKNPNLKVYYLGPMYRRERPQKGRFRQFYQIGVENFGSSSSAADVEVIEMLASYLKKVGLGEWTVQISSLGEGDERKTYKIALREFLGKHKGGFCDDCKQRIPRNPLRVLDCKNPACIELSKGHPDILNFLGSQSRDHFDSLKKGLDELSVSYEVNPKMVRGIDYYQRTVFEFISNKLGAQATVAAGGRYDSLVKDLGGADIPGTGFAIGMERLLMLLAKKEEHHSQKKIFMAFLGDSAQSVAQQLVQKLRRAGLICEMDYDFKSLKSQLRRADKLGCSHVVMLGEDEIKSGLAAVKNFKKGTQEEVLLTNLVSYFVA